MLTETGFIAVTLPFRGLLIIINLSLPRRRESSDVKSFWIPAFAGMTFLEVALIFKSPKSTEMF